jgi:hypothetical protein
MKFFNHIISILAVLVLIAVGVGSAFYTGEQNSRGGFSEVCGRVSSEDKQELLALFGHCQTEQELFDALLKFGCANFEYTKEGLKPLQKVCQYFDLRQFIDTGYQGVCFDFSCFCKVVSVVWAEAKGVDLQAYVYDFAYDSGRHSVNVFRVGDKTYYLDITADVYEYQDCGKHRICGVVEIDIAPEVYLAVTYKQFRLMAVR